MNVIDLFAGAGGWDLAARDLGFDPLGIEGMDEACATREAAGLRTVQADIATLDPEEDPTRWDGLIASPPCQAYSMAGKGAGRRDVEHVVQCARDIAAGVDSRADYAAACEDDRSILVVEPLRWALALRPRWIVLEQVPPVLELWRLFESFLRAEGYDCWTGILSAERYGVPQTRRRAFLIASLDGPVHPPAPTHQAYVPGEPAKPAEVDLFGDGLLPWVSMAQALGWEEGPSPSPSPSVTGGGGATGGVEVYGSLHARRRARAAVAFRATNDRANVATRELVSPAPTLSFGHEAPVWVTGRPATTVNGDPRISKPGHHDSNVSGSQQEAAVRVSQQEAAVLQTFPADYPWQGSRSKRFLQIGNAVPPLLAKAVLQTVVG